MPMYNCALHLRSEGSVIARPKVAALARSEPDASMFEKGGGTRRGVRPDRNSLEHRKEGGCRNPVRAFPSALDAQKRARSVPGRTSIMAATDAQGERDGHGSELCHGRDPLASTRTERDRSGMVRRTSFIRPWLDDESDRRAIRRNGRAPNATSVGRRAREIADGLVTMIGSERGRVVAPSVALAGASMIAIGRRADRRIGTPRGGGRALVGRPPSVPIASIARSLVPSIGDLPYSPGRLKRRHSGPRVKVGIASATSPNAINATGPRGGASSWS